MTTGMVAAEVTRRISCPNCTVVRLVLLPHESHGYVARESVLHTLAEMLEWADKYVKNRKPVPAATPSP